MSLFLSAVARWLGRGWLIRLPVMIELRYFPKIMAIMSLRCYRGGRPLLPARAAFVYWRVPFRAPVSSRRAREASDGSNQCQGSGGWGEASRAWPRPLSGKPQQCSLPPAQPPFIPETGLIPWKSQYLGVNVGVDRLIQGVYTRQIKKNNALVPNIVKVTHPL